MTQQVHLSEPINRNQILMTFQKYGYPPDSMINKEKMISIFKAQFDNKRQTFNNNHIIQQIWDQSQATSKGQISINTIAEILEQAQNILQVRIVALSSPNGMIEQTDRNIRQKQIQVNQFAKYYGEDRDQLNRLTKQLMNMQIQQKQNRFDLKSFKQDYQTINGIFYLQQPRNLTQYILPTKQQPKFQKSNKLLTIFHFTNILFIVDLLILSSLRLSFLTLTATFHSYYLLFYGIQNPSNFTYIVLHFLLSIIADIAFIIIKLMNKYEIMPIQHNSYNIYLFILSVVLIGSIILRIFCLVLYLSLRSSYSPKVINYFVLFGQILPPKKIQNQPQYAYYSKVGNSPNYQPTQNFNKENLYKTEIKDSGSYNITINSPPKQSFNDYSSVQPIKYMDMNEGENIKF